jgi:DNA-binding response OmpR family regulator
MRRVSSVPEIIEKGLLKLDVLAGLAFINGGDLLLAQKEFSLLLLFVQNEDKTMSAEYLYEKVWKMTLNDNTNALKNTISRLRNKIFDSGYTILAVRGEGYAFKRE